MNFKFYLLLKLYLYLSFFTSAQYQVVKFVSDPENAASSIVIKFKPNGENRQAFSLYSRPFHSAAPINWKEEKTKDYDDTLAWTLDASKPVYVSLEYLTARTRLVWLAEPGDNLLITQENCRTMFKGRGHEKFELQFKIDSLLQTIKKPANHHAFPTKSIEDYLEWNTYLDRQLELIIPLIDSYKNKISAFTYSQVKADFIDRIIDSRSDKLGSFMLFARESGISNNTICAIYDSTYGSIALDLLRQVAPYRFGSWKPIKNYVRRKYSFHLDQYPLNSDIQRHALYYKLGLEIYNQRGNPREDFLVEFLTKEMIDDLGFIPETVKMLEEYYATPGFPEHKNYVKDFEAKARFLKSGLPAPGFTLTDRNGKAVTKENFEGKVVLMDFWFTGCTGCVEMTRVLNRMENEFRKDTNVVFLSISIDKEREKWIKSIAQKKYTTGSGVNLYTNGLGDADPMIRTFNIHGYPSLYLLDAEGQIILNPLPDPRNDNGAQLTDLIRKQLVLAKDGPYVFTKNDSINVVTLNGLTVTETKWHKSKPPTLTVESDNYQKPFQVRLKSAIKNEPSRFEKPQKILAISDIEGNFAALRKLLQANRVIDDEFNWIFAKGHLVFAGDMFDRGSQVTECLWLIYSLEEKAKAAGGYVHFILGNHEIMNLSSDTVYTLTKYRKNARTICGDYATLFNEYSELGKWLRSKNLAEKIGDVLFVHGGISEEVNQLPLSLEEINQMARKNFDTYNQNNLSAQSPVKILFHNKHAPHWYRSYYQEDSIKLYTTGDTLFRATEDQVKRTLQKFDISRIITGHTIVGNSINVHFNQKVINIDTRHARGMSEALLIEGDFYYKMNQAGERILLFIAPKRR